jgi:hypothetical protein
MDAVRGKKTEWKEKKEIVADRPVPADVDVVRSFVGETAFDGPTFT